MENMSFLEVQLESDPRKVKPLNFIYQKIPSLGRLEIKMNIQTAPLISDGKTTN